MSRCVCLRAIERSCAFGQRLLPDSIGVALDVERIEQRSWGVLRKLLGAEYGED